MNSLLSIVRGVLTASALLWFSAAGAVEPGLRPGTLTSTGSDTLANLMTLWAEAFQTLHPNVSVQVQAPGSSTASPALALGTADLGPMSRAMKDLEVAAFELRHGYPPTAVRVALDALAIYVHKDNPIDRLTLDQVDAMFSATGRCGYARRIVTWGQLGMEGSWSPRRLVLFGRNSVSGTYGYFKQEALCGGDFKATVNEQPGSASVVQSVATSLSGIGYSGIGYRTSGVRPVPLAWSDDGIAHHATTENALSGDYPLTRYLYIYVNKHPVEGMPAKTLAFLDLVLSARGQDVVRKDGYVPLSESVIATERNRLSLPTLDDGDPLKD